MMNLSNDSLTHPYRLPDSTGGCVLLCFGPGLFGSSHLLVRLFGFRSAWANEGPKERQAEVVRMSNLELTETR